MDSHKKTATIVGVLFIVATGMLFVGGAIYGPILNSPDYLGNAYPNRMTVILGLLLEFIVAPAMVLIPVFLFPVLRRHDEAFALAYVSFRLFEAVLVTMVGILNLSLIRVSQAYLDGGATDASYAQTIGSAIQSLSEWAFSIYVIVFTLGALIFYSALYRSKLIPRWISGWGFIAAALLLTGTVLVMFEVLAGMSDAAVQLIFAMPIAVNEMVLSIRLIVKGFDSSAIAAGSA